MLRLLALVGILALGIGNNIAADFPEGSPNFKTSFADAKKAAEASGKPRVVIFSAKWCGPCQEMKKEVYPDAAIRPFHDRYEWVYVDVDDNEKLATEFNVNSIPRIDIIAADGTVLATQVGGGSIKEFMKFLTQGLSKAKS